MSGPTLVVLQGRMTSSRLPGKVMMEINGKPMIYWQIQRILKSKRVDSLVVATSIDPSDDALALFLEENSISVYRGALDNVFSRYFFEKCCFKRLFLKNVVSRDFEKISKL